MPINAYQKDGFLSYEESMDLGDTSLSDVLKENLYIELLNQWLSSRSFQCRGHNPLHFLMSSSRDELSPSKEGELLFTNCGPLSNHMLIEDLLKTLKAIYRKDPGIVFDEQRKKKLSLLAKSS